MGRLVYLECEQSHYIYLIQLINVKLAGLFAFVAHSSSIWGYVVRKETHKVLYDDDYEYDDDDDDDEEEDRITKLIQYLFGPVPHGLSHVLKREQVSALEVRKV